jgi:hypothetical protein
VGPALNRALPTIVMLRQTIMGQPGPPAAASPRAKASAKSAAAPERTVARQLYRLLERTGHQLEDSKHQDPAGQPGEVVRRIRDDIDGRVRRLLAEFAPTGA